MRGEVQDLERHSRKGRTEKGRAEKERAERSEPKTTLENRDERARFARPLSAYL